MAVILDVKWGMWATIGSIIPNKGVECGKDKEVLHETPGANKPIDAVIQAQKDLGDIVHTLLKGKGLSTEGQSLTFWV